MDFVGVGQGSIEKKPKLSNKESVQLPEDEKCCDIDKVKIEEVEIVEQFVDENQAHDRDTFVVKMENYGNIGSLSEQDYEKTVPFSLQEEKPLENVMKEEKCELIPEELVCEKNDHQSQNRDMKMDNYDNTNDLLRAKEDLKSINSNLKEHKCHLCEYSSSEKFNLERHIDLVHLNLKCHLCTFASKVPETLKTHIETVHSDSKQHKCHFCEFASRHKYSIKKHIDSVHLNLKPHKCHICKHAFYRKTHLRKHVDEVHSKNHKCNFCDFASNSEQWVKKHIDRVHLNLKEHKCDKCDYASNKKKYLRKHVDSVHSNLKEHKCDKCDYASSRKESLKRHINSVHLNLKQCIKQ